MKVITGKVVAGKIVVEGEPLEEGSTVTGDRILGTATNGTAVSFPSHEDRNSPAGMQSIMSLGLRQEKSCLSPPESYHGFGLP